MRSPLLVIAAALLVACGDGDSDQDPTPRPCPCDVDEWGPDYCYEKCGGSRDAA